MKKIFNKELLEHYFVKHDMRSIFDEGILRHAALHFYEKEEFVLKAEQELEYYYLLVDGKIKVTYLFENGKSILLKFYKDFNIIGDLELLRSMPVRCNVEATEDTYMIAIPSAILRRDYMDNVNFLHHLIDSLSEKLYTTINNSSYNSVYPLVNRLSSYLFEHIAKDRGYVLLGTSFKEIAQFLGTTYRHLSRTLKELEAKSVIRCEGKKIYILDERKLRELSKNLYMDPL